MTPMEARRDSTSGSAWEMYRGAAVLKTWMVRLLCVGSLMLGMSK